MATNDDERKPLVTKNDNSITIEIPVAMLRALDAPVDDPWLNLDAELARLGLRRSVGRAAAKRGEIAGACRAGGPERGAIVVRRSAFDAWLGSNPAHLRQSTPKGAVVLALNSARQRIEKGAR